MVESLERMMENIRHLRREVGELLRGLSEVGEISPDDLKKWHRFLGEDPREEPESRTEVRPTSDASHLARGRGRRQS